MAGKEQGQGHLEIVLDAFLKSRGVSKNKLAKAANLQRTQLNEYCKNKVRRMDFDVLERICGALNCDLTDVVRYVRTEKPAQGPGGAAKEPVPGKA